VTGNAEEGLHVRNVAYLAGEDIAMAYFKTLSLHKAGAKQTETLVRNTVTRAQLPVVFNLG
jgi:hypothetical protein